MNKLILLTVALGLGFAGNAQPWKKKKENASPEVRNQNQHRLEATVYRPSIGKYYSYSTFDSSYMLNSYVSYTYDSEGRLISQASRSTYDSSLQSVSNYKYNSEGERYFTENLSYMNNVLSHGYRYIDSDTGYVNETYNSSTQQWIVSPNSSKTIRETLTDGTLVEIYQRLDSNGVYVNKDKYEEKYNSQNQLSEYLEYIWDGDSWVPESRSYDVTWYDYSNFVASSYKTQTYYNNQWIEATIASGQMEGNMWVETEDTIINGERRHLSRSYSGTEKVNVPYQGMYLDKTYYEEGYYRNEDFINGEWKVTYESEPVKKADGSITDYSFDNNYDENGVLIESSRSTAYYNANGDLTFRIYEEFNGTDYDTTNAYRNIYEYDANNNMISNTSEYYYDGTWSKGSRTEYSNFLPYEVPTGLGFLSAGTAKMAFYPNPSTTGVFKLDEAATVRITDGVGNFITETNSQTIDLSACSPGFYYATMEVDGKRVVSKLIVQ